jgi:hypothetical protein
MSASCGLCFNNFNKIESLQHIIECTLDHVCKARITSTCAEYYCLLYIFGFIKKYKYRIDNRNSSILRYVFGVYEFIYFNRIGSGFRSPALIFDDFTRLVLSTLTQFYEIQLNLFPGLELEDYQTIVPNIHLDALFTSEQLNELN